MNWNQIAGKWNEMSGKVKNQWGRLTDDDVAAVGGRREELLGRIQQRYGYERERAEQEIDRWMQAL